MTRTINEQLEDLAVHFETQGRRYADLRREHSRHRLGSSSSCASYSYDLGAENAYFSAANAVRVIVEERS